MTIFSDRIETAYFINGRFDTIRVEYTDDEGNRRGHILPNNDSDPDFQALKAEGWDIKKIHDGTAEIRRQDAVQFNAIVNDEVNARVDEIMRRYNISNYKQYSKDAEGWDAGEHTDHSKMWDHLSEINENKDDVFAFKMWALDSEWAKKATRDQKKALRRAQSILEGLSVLYLMQ